MQADALEFYSEVLQQQLRELQQLQQQTRWQLPRPAAFVTFRYALHTVCVGAKEDWAASILHVATCCRLYSGSPTSRQLCL